MVSPRPTFSIDIETAVERLLSVQLLDGDAFVEGDNKDGSIIWSKTMIRFLLHFKIRIACMRVGFSQPRGNPRAEVPTARCRELQQSRGDPDNKRRNNHTRAGNPVEHLVDQWRRLNQLPTSKTLLILYLTIVA
jgi:hypothetical protein